MEHRKYQKKKIFIYSWHMYVLVNCKAQSVNKLSILIKYTCAFHSSQNMIFYNPDMDNFERLHVETANAS